jgi:hemoglobin/transferrin/lactoferrin receptor protein
LYIGAVISTNSCACRPRTAGLALSTFLVVAALSGRAARAQVDAGAPSPGAAANTDAAVVGEVGVSTEGPVVDAGDRQPASQPPPQRPTTTAAPQAPAQGDSAVAQAAPAPPPPPTTTPPPAPAPVGGEDGENLLLETTVVASRRDERIFESPRSVEVVRRADIDEQASRTTPEILLEQPGVFLQRTNYGGGMPIIRGQHGNRVLLLVDGIRINNATTRSGPNQFLNTVDPLLVQRVEVLRGTGSAVHGSDALGGAVNVITEAPWLGGAGRVTGSAIVQGATFDESGSVGGRLRWSGDRSAGVAIASARHFGDLRGGPEIGVQPFNGYDEWNAAGAVGFALGANGTLTTSVQTTQQRNVLRTFGSTPEDFRLFTRQARTLGYVRYEHTHAGPFDRARVTASYHYQDEQFDRYRIARNLHLREDTTVGTLGLQVEAVASHARAGTTTTGIDVYVDSVTATGGSGQIAGAPVAMMPQLGRYVPGAGYATAGAFANHTLPLGERLRLTGEMRVGGVRVSLPSDNRLVLLFPSEGLSPLPAHSEIVPVYAGGLYLRSAINRYLAGYAGTSLGFRAPNLDDYSRLGVEGTGYVTPTRGLLPERAAAGEIGIKTATPSFEASLAYSYTYIFDAMTRTPAAVGTVTMLDGAPILRVSNGESARFHSIELGGRGQVWRGLFVVANATYTRGNQRRQLDATAPGLGSIDEPAPKVPPPFGMAALGWRSSRPGRWSVQGVLRFALAQTRLAEADLLDTRICPDVPGRCAGTSGWATVGLRGSLRLADSLRLVVIAENLTNTSYRMHASGIDGPGRGLLASVEGILP